MDLLDGDTMEMGTEALMERQMQHEGCCPSMSLRLRVAGFSVCAIFGLLCIFLGLSNLFGVATGDVLPFALPYTMGTCFMLASGCFLMGPVA